MLTYQRVVRPATLRYLTCRIHQPTSQFTPWLWREKPRFQAAATSVEGRVTKPWSLDGTQMRIAGSWMLITSHYPTYHINIY